jgi:cytoskeleton protein RodZ
MPSVGEILAAERRRQGKSLNDAVEGTKIRSRLLDALENGRYDELPNPAYVKGYIQSYARYLEIPSEPLLAQFKHEYSVHQKGVVNPNERYLRMSPADLRKLPADEVVPERQQAHAIPRNVWIAVAAGSILLLLIMCAIGRSCTSAGTSGTLPQPAGGGQTSGAVTASPGATLPPEPTTTVTAVTNTFKLRVTVRAGQASWMQVTVDGLKAFEGTLADGESREWLVSKGAIVTAGRPDVVTVTKDGQKVPFKMQGGNGVITLTVSE